MISIKYVQNKVKVKVVISGKVSSLPKVIKYVKRSRFQRKTYAKFNFNQLIYNCGMLNSYLNKDSFIARNKM